MKRYKCIFRSAYSAISISKCSYYFPLFNRQCFMVNRSDVSPATLGVSEKETGGIYSHIFAR